jgi:type I restriction enzyme R subunit
MWDSMPASVIGPWREARDRWLRQHGIDPWDKTWRAKLQRLSRAEPRDFHQRISARWEAHLDEGHGTCVLRQSELAAIVGESFHRFDGDRYLLTDFVVMPNHVHLLAAFPVAGGMLKQCDSWKHYTAVRINQALGRRGRFWQTDDFDHLVRSEEQFHHLRRYIAENPRRARLSAGEYLHYSRAI